jgi:hypothetical protein
MVLLSKTATVKGFITKELFYVPGHKKPKPNENHVSKTGM